MADRDGDRHEPLPPLTRLPGFIWARLPIAARAALAILAVAVVAAIAVMAPRIGDTKRENAARERRAAAAQEAARIRRLRSLQRPRSARSTSVDPGRGGSAVREHRRRGLLRDLAEAIAADARSRGARRVLRTDCHGAPGSRLPERDLTRSRVPLACVAVTSEVAPSPTSSGATLGYPHRAVVDFRSGRLTWCRVAGQPGEGGFVRRRQVPVPAACTG